ncbi:LOW QUALITY PROTEIN: sperm microtubule associated protein 2-like [Amphiura filiformis]|uniref:LOW QUALITY PROTEIN: sperm microtubule associated protein 2-like n=1 Tax=Amphiura filiformis TaxID=82378 RepID=UPI003B214828
MATAVKSRRIDVLSTPKQLPPGYREDRRSVYWVDKLPPIPGAEGTTQFVLTDWQDKLCGTKPVNAQWTGDRPTPIWKVSQAAQKAEASQRVVDLAGHKNCHRDYVPDRAVRTKVSDAAKTASCSSRIEQLAKEKTFSALPVKESWEFDCYVWDPEISKSAKNARCSDRLDNLAEQKRYHRSFQVARPVMWSVDDSSLKAIASLRIQQLARPKSRSKYETFDPYKVSNGALHARPTPRVDELSAPIPRKVRQKKQTGGGSS